MSEAFNGLQVKERRESYGWTPAMMALRWYARFGEPISIQTILNWEKGQRPNSSNLMRLSRLLGVTPAYFFQKQRGCQRGDQSA
jgi:transcriptional regulator with XRE-family HTH domain